MNQPYYTTKILIADDHEMVRDGLRVMINKIPELEVIGEAANGLELVQQTTDLKPEVILTDVKMPKMNGIEAVKIIKEQFPHIGIIALSSYDEENLITDMLNAGVKGYLLKNTSKEELKKAVIAAANDEYYYCDLVSQKLAKIISNGGHISKNQEEGLFTERELEVIRMICQELTSKEIGHQLGLQPRTVERYRDAIMDKMDVKNIAGVVKYAIHHKLYSD